MAYVDDVLGFARPRVVTLQAALAMADEVKINAVDLSAQNEADMKGAIDDMLRVFFSSDDALPDVGTEDNPLGI